MDKILTISVAAYNVQDYITQCLESLVGIKDIEVLIIDDGSTDDTLNIAKRYEREYPDTFKVIHKDNGGYGSTVNYSIQHANGKYFKLLDGDDWFDTSGTIKLIESLQTLDVDVVFTKFKKWYYKDDIFYKVTDGINYPNNYFDRKINIKDFDFNEGIPMHAITYKTQILKDMHLCLPEHMLYTDNYYATLPFKRIENVIFKDIYVYNYRLGTDNQSVSKEKLIKNANDSKIISLDLAKEYKGENEYLLNRIAATCVDYFVILKKMGNARDKMISFDNEIKAVSEDVYKKMATLHRNASKALRLYRMINYLFL